MSSLGARWRGVALLGLLACQPPPVVEPPPPPPAAPPRALWLRGVGDVMLARGIERQWTGTGHLGALFASTRALLRAADLTVANLESPIAAAGRPEPKPIKFRAHRNALFALTDAGVDVVSLANNHAFDYTVAALDETVANLTAVGIVPVGAGPDGGFGGAAIVARNGLRVAFLAFSEFNWSPSSVTDDPRGVSILAALVAEAATRADLVVVSYHWGIEYLAPPTERQRFLGRLLVDLGADLVLGHHPHIPQGVEVYRGRAIVYSLGNFLFDQPWPYTRNSLIVDWQVDDAGQHALALLPVRITPRPFVPEPLYGAEAAEQLDAYAALSAALGTTATRVGDRLVIGGLEPAFTAP